MALLPKCTRLARYRRLAALVGLLAPGIVLVRCYLNAWVGTFLSGQPIEVVLFLAVHGAPWLVLELGGLLLAGRRAAHAILFAGAVVLALDTWLGYSSKMVLDRHFVLLFLELPAIAIVTLLLALLLAVCEVLSSLASTRGRGPHRDRSHSDSATAMPFPRP